MFSFDLHVCNGIGCNVLYLCHCYQCTPHLSSGEALHFLSEILHIALHADQEVSGLLVPLGTSPLSHDCSTGCPGYLFFSSSSSPSSFSCCRTEEEDFLSDMPLRDQEHSDKGDVGGKAVRLMESETPVVDTRACWREEERARQTQRGGRS